MNNNHLNYKFLSYPNKLTLNDYSGVINKYIKSVVNSDIARMYQIGSVNDCGISDIDIFVVLKDEIIFKNKNIYSIGNLNSFEKYMFMHDVYVLPERIEDRIGTIFNIENINLLYGDMKGNIINKYDIANNSSAKLACIIDFTLDILKYVASAFIKKEIHVRQMLCVLQSLKHTIKLCRSVCEYGQYLFDNGDNYIDEIFELRNNFFEIAEFEIKYRIIKLMHLSMRIISEILSYANEYIIKNNIISIDDLNGTQAVLNYGDKFYYVFTNRFCVNTFIDDVYTHSRMETTSGLYSKYRNIHNRIVVLLPQMLLMQYLYYAKQIGIVSKRINMSLYVNNNVSLEGLNKQYAHILNIKMSVANDQVYYIRSNSFTCGQIFLYHFICDRYIYDKYLYVLRKLNFMDLSRVFQ